MGYPKIRNKRICYRCGSETTAILQGKYEHWLMIDGQIHCKKCWSYLYNQREENKARHRILVKKFNNRKLRFKDKRPYLKTDPRTGFCSRCGKFGNTDMHHIEYHDEDPLRDTIELCDSCHTKESWRVRKLRLKVKEGHEHLETVY